MKLLRSLSIALILSGFLFNALLIQKKAFAQPDSNTPFGVTLHPESGDASVQDFAFFWHVSDYWSRGELKRPYHSESLVTFFHQWTGLDNPELAMRFFYHPALLLGLVPLTWIQPEWGYGLFAFASLLLVLFMIGRIILRSTNSRGIIILSVLFFISLGLPATLSIGQFSPIFAACLAPLVLMTGARLSDPSKQVTASLLLFSIKPTLAFPIVTSLIPARQPRSLKYFFIISFFVLLILTAFVGWRWPFDYIASALSHTGTEAENAFRAGTGSGTHANLSNLLERVSPLSNGTVTGISAGLWLLALSIPWLLKNSDPSIGWAASFAVMTYLLFSPHLNRADELLAFGPLLFLVARSAWQPKVSATLAILSAAILFNLCYLGMNLPVLIIVLSAKLLIVALLIAQIKHSDNTPDPITS